MLSSNSNLNHNSAVNFQACFIPSHCTNECLLVILACYCYLVVIFVHLNRPKQESLIFCGVNPIIRIQTSLQKLWSDRLPQIYYKLNWSNENVIFLTFKNKYVYYSIDSSFGEKYFWSSNLNLSQMSSLLKFVNQKIRAVSRK